MTAHAIVTGASSGLGAAMARSLAGAGYSLTLVARRRELLEQLAEEVAPTLTHIATCDLANPDGEAAVAWLPRAIDALGPPQILINNAGIQIIRRTAEGDPEEGDLLLRLNLHLPMRLTRAVLPGMLERRSGVIVDVASMAALAPTPGMYYYNASKAGLAAASEALRGELAGTGVHVVTVYPGIIPTTALAQAGLDAYESNWALSLQPTGTPEGLADRVLAAIRRPKRHPRVIYPAFNRLARMFPGATRWVLDTFSPPMK